MLTGFDKVLITAGFIMLAFTMTAFYLPGPYTPAWEILASLTGSIWSVLIGKKMDKDA